MKIFRQSFLDSSEIETPFGLAGLSQHIEEYIDPRLMQFW